MLEPPKGKLPDDWEPRPQTLFRATQFGDEVDRPLKKSDGSWTYFAADIAYHHDKLRRGFDNLIDVWGADHGGYVKRMQAAVQALTDGERCARRQALPARAICSTRAQPVRMSKRAGTFVTLREVVDEVGKDVFRFIMLTRRNDQTLDFDFAKVTEQSKDNPVFYVQYAHARAASVMRHAAEQFPERRPYRRGAGEAPLERLSDPSELALIRQLAGWPRLVESAAEAHEPHRIAFYLQEVAAQFHLLWNKGKDEATLRFIIAGDPGVDPRAAGAGARRRARHRVGARRVRGRAGGGDVSMSYQLGSDRSRRARPTLCRASRRTKRRGRRRRGLIASLVLAVVVMAVFAGGLWFAYHQGTQHGGVGGTRAADVPLIRADERPTKVKPEKPGGMDVPDQDKLLYTAKPGGAPVEHLLPPPEQPMPRPRRACCRRSACRRPRPPPVPPAADAAASGSRPRPPSQQPAG